MTQAIREGRLSVDDLKTSLSDYGNVVETTFNNTLSPTDQAKVAFNNLKLAGTELATSMFNAVAPALQSLVSSLQKAVTWFSNLDDGTKETIVKIAALVAAIGPVLVIVGMIKNGNPLEKTNITEVYKLRSSLNDYKELKKEGRIEFTTFHQSYGYEIRS